MTVNGTTTLNGTATLSGPTTLNGSTNATGTIVVTPPADNPGLDVRSQSRGINLECGITYPNPGVFAQGIFALVVNGNGGGNGMRTIMEATNGNATGVSIEALAAQSGIARGVVAEANSGGSSNCYGVTSEAFGDRDCYGLHASSSSGGAASDDSIGVYGEAGGNNAARYGVFGKTGSGGYAVYADGNFAATGTKNFIHPHPADATKEIHFTCLEGNENGCYFRGRGQVASGVAWIVLPPEWAMVVSKAPDSVTVHLTPVRSFSRLAAWEVRADGIEVRGTEDCEFTYWVVGLRRGFETHEPFADNHAFRPKTAGVPFGSEYPKPYRDLLVENGTLNPDYTPNLQTAAKAAWQLRDAEADEIQKAVHEEMAWQVRQVGGRRR